ncbi:MAG: PilN domain-containing protein [Candidatus Binatota bacterium]
MIRINLLPVKELSAEVGRRQELLVAGLSLTLTVALAVGLYLFQSFRLYGLSTEAGSLKKEIETLNVQLKEVGDLQQKVKALEDKIKVIDDLTKKKVGPVKIMESLSLATPPRLWLTEFRESSGNLTISGLAVDNQTVADFLKSLSTFVYFANVDLVETTQVEQEGIPLKKFSIRSQLLYQPPPPVPAPAPAQKAGAAPAPAPAKKEAK